MKIASIDIPDSKNIEIALTYVYGVGRSTAKKILKALNIDPSIRAKDLTPEQVNLLQKHLGTIKFEGDLRREVSAHISRLIMISCYRGIRHREGLPVRGQKCRNKGGKRRERRRRKATQ